MNAGRKPSESAKKTEQFLKEFFDQINSSRRSDPQFVRDMFNAVSEKIKDVFPETEAPQDIEVFTNKSPRGVWYVPSGVDSTKRLLYLHGGAYRAGSSQSHELFTKHLAKNLGVAILSLDYRLLPIKLELGFSARYFFQR